MQLVKLVKCSSILVFLVSELFFTIFLSTKISADKHFMCGVCHLNGIIMLIKMDIHCFASYINTGLLQSKVSTSIMTIKGFTLTVLLTAGVRTQHLPIMTCFSSIFGRCFHTFEIKISWRSG